MNKIRSLHQARQEFSTEHKCREYLRRMRWPDGVTCPRCGSKHVTYMKSREKWLCKCRYQFSVTAGTIFHKTHIDLPRWMIAIWQIVHSPKGISSKQLQRELGTTYKTAWYMAKRIRWAIQHTFLGVVVDGTVEIDESIINADGGLATGNVKFNTKDVLGIASRESGVLRMVVLRRLFRFEIERVCSKNFGQVSQIYSDAATRLRFLKNYAPHGYINHWLGYADGDVHVNTVESAWALFKRGLVGVFHHVSSKYLQEYLDEFAFRFTYRKHREDMFDQILMHCAA